MVGNIVARALTIAFDPRYMPRLLCGRCVSRLPTYQHWSSRRCSGAPEEACCQMLGEKRGSGKHNRAGLVLAIAIASSNTSGHTSNSHACVCLGGTAVLDRHRHTGTQAQTGTDTPMSALPCCSHPAGLASAARRRLLLSYPRHLYEAAHGHTAVLDTDLVPGLVPALVCIMRNGK
jgi:hypothetical protein